MGWRFLTTDTRSATRTIRAVACPIRRESSYKGTSNKRNEGRTFLVANACAGNCKSDDELPENLRSAPVGCPDCQPPEPHTLGAQQRLTELELDLPLLRQRLYEWVHGYGDDDDVWREALVGSAPEPHRRAEFYSDTPTGPDWLDIEQDVVALATLIAACNSAPPLSIGLFGDWGSGKTFFMSRLREAVAGLSKNAGAADVMQRDLPFYKRIVQIEFNAWHYVEGNLWASMVQHILENLRIFDEQPPTETETLQQHWINQLGFKEKANAEAEEKQRVAARRVTEAEKAVESAKQVHEDKKKDLQALSRKSAARDFKLSGALREISHALAPLGVIPMTDAVTDLQSSLREARSVIESGNALLTPLIHAVDKGNRWRSLIIILLGGPLAGAGIGLLLAALRKEHIAQISAFLTATAGILTGCAGWLRKQAQWMSQRAKQVEDAQRKYDEELAKALADTAEQKAKTEAELALARQEYTLAEQRAEQARREEQSARADLSAATTSRLLGQFIQDRASSTDYRKHLGVLAIVRQDFQKLSRLIEEDNWKLSPEEPGGKRYAGRLQKIGSLEEEMKDASTRINRIVLYIDDLDRCPPAKVVDVLQAVHLLLAFPLFVVVVGVDARWISRSLETRYRELLHIGNTEAAVDLAQMFGVARSEDYLEKIFQIPLWLRKMDANAARRMVQGLLRNSMDVDHRAEYQPERFREVKPQTDTPGGVVNEAQNGDDSAASGTASPTEDTDSPKNGIVTSQGQQTVIPNVESLRIRSFELSAMDAFSPLLGRSPRALKRFVNIYRLIKAGLPVAEHDAFIRPKKESMADFEAVLLLLAIDTGLPRVAQLIFEVLLTLPNKHKVSVQQLIEIIDGQPLSLTADWTTLRSWLADRQATSFLTDAVARLAEWVPRVSRYSFQASVFEGSRGPVRPAGQEEKPSALNRH